MYRTFDNDDNEMFWLNSSSPEELYEKTKQELLILHAHISINQDLKQKVIGDRVKVWDGSWNRDKNTGEHRNGIDILFKNNFAIVIETNCDQWCDNSFNDELHQLDLLLIFPNGEQVYCSSKLVKKID